MIKQSHILVVDDNPHNLRILVNILENTGFTVRLATDGQEALNSAISNPPDLILLDIMMPGMDGYETCRRMKADERIREIPIIFISARDDSLNKIKAFTTGGVDYISKPFNFDELKARIETHLSLRNAHKELKESNVRLKSEIKKREEIERVLLDQNMYLKALHQISLDLISHLDLEDMMQNLLSKAADLIGASSGYIYLYDAENDELEIRFAIGKFLDYLGFRTKSGVGLGGTVWQTGRPILIDDYQLWTERLKKTEFHQIHSLVGIPLKLRNRIEGVIGLGHTEKDKTFQEGVIEILELFGKLASIAIEKAEVYASMNQEIVRRKQMEDQFRRANDFLENIFENSADIITIVNEKGRFVKWNKMAEEFFGYHIDEFKGRSSFSLYPDKEKLESMLDKLRGDGMVKRHEIDMINKAGDILPTEISISLLKDDNHKTIGSVAVMRDLSDLKKILNETRKAHQFVQATNNKINESLRYAAMIQFSLLPSMDNIRSWFPDSFLIWEPRDIVGGDIVYIDSFDDGFVVAIIDCTGHGIPGAFMTMIASSALRRIIRDEKCHDPARILERLNYIVKTSLQQDTDYALSDDGLDAGICFIEKTRVPIYEDMKKNTALNLVFASARIPLFYVLDGKVNIIKGDRQSLGYKRSDLNFTFTRHTVDIDKEISFYLSTDGFIDQLGGDKKRSFGKKKFKNTLLDIRHMSFQNQKKALIRDFAEYKGEDEKQDDVTIFGFGFKGKSKK